MKLTSWFLKRGFSFEWCRGDRFVSDEGPDDVMKFTLYTCPEQDVFKLLPQHQKLEMVMSYILV